MKKKKEIHKYYQRLDPTETSSIEKTNFPTVSKDWPYKQQNNCS